MIRPHAVGYDYNYIHICLSPLGILGKKITSMQCIILSAIFGSFLKSSSIMPLSEYRHAYLHKGWDPSVAIKKLKIVNPCYELFLLQYG